MNERIRELAEQAGAGWDHKYHWYVGSETMQKFAELLVRECAQNSANYEIPKEELEQELEHNTNMYVFFKDLCFDILEEKITMDQLAQVLYGFDRGHDQ